MQIDSINCLIEWKLVICFDVAFKIGANAYDHVQLRRVSQSSNLYYYRLPIYFIDCAVIFFPSPSLLSRSFGFHLANGNINNNVLCASAAEQVGPKGKRRAKSNGN